MLIKTTKQSIREEWHYLTFLQIFHVCLVADSWILISVSTFNLLCYVLVEVYEENLVYIDTQLKKKVF